MDHRGLTRKIARKKKASERYYRKVLFLLVSHVTEGNVTFVSVCEKVIIVSLVVLLMSHGLFAS